MQCTATPVSSVQAGQTQQISKLSCAAAGKHLGIEGIVGTLSLAALQGDLRYDALAFSLHTQQRQLRMMGSIVAACISS